MLSPFSCVWLFATLWTVTHQVPLSIGFSRQGYWSVSSHALLQGILPTQESNPCLLWLPHPRWILYHWVTREAQYILYHCKIIKILSSLGTFGTNNHRLPFSLTKHSQLFRLPLLWAASETVLWQQLAGDLFFYSLTAEASCPCKTLECIQ